MTLVSCASLHFYIDQVSVNCSLDSVFYSVTDFRGLGIIEAIQSSHKISRDPSDPLETYAFSDLTIHVLAFRDHDSPPSFLIKTCVTQKAPKVWVLLLTTFYIVIILYCLPKCYMFFQNQQQIFASMPFPARFSSAPFDSQRHYCGHK